MTGGVLSILIMTEAKDEILTPFVAEQVKVMPGVSAVKLDAPQPFEDVMPDSGSVTFQVTVTLLRYQPLFPRLPEICGMMTGGVVSGPCVSFVTKASPPPPNAAW